MNSSADIRADIPKPKLGVLWWKDAVIYEVYVDKFAGTFAGFVGRLDYLKQLGIDCIHVLPHYPSPMVDDGYDISDYRNVRPELGMLEDFKWFVSEAHARGIRVMIDLVLNHVSEQHPWFVEARASKDSPKRGYFIWSQTGKELAGSPNVFQHLKPDNWIYNEPTSDYYYTTFYAQQPDLNWDNPEVLKEIIDVVHFWIGLGVDGFRLDAAAHLVKREGTRSKNLPETHAVLRRFREHLQRTAPHVALLAEVNDGPNEVKKYFGAESGDECQLVYHFPLAEKLFLAAFKDDASVISDAVNNLSGIPSECQWAVFLRNHDQLSLVTLTDAEREAFVRYCDPENRYGFKTEHGISMRGADIFKKDPAKIRRAFELLLGLPASPIIYYGEEIGMENDMSLGTQTDTRRYVRGAFDWAKAEAQMTDPNSLFSFVRQLIQLRKTAPVQLSAQSAEPQPI